MFRFWYKMRLVLQIKCPQWLNIFFDVDKYNKAHLQFDKEWFDPIYMDGTRQNYYSTHDAQEFQYVYGPWDIETYYSNYTLILMIFDEMLYNLVKKIGFNFIWWENWPRSLRIIVGAFDLFMTCYTIMMFCLTAHEGFITYFFLFGCTSDYFDLR